MLIEKGSKEMTSCILATLPCVSPASCLAFLLPSRLGRNSRLIVRELNIPDLWPFRMIQWIFEDVIGLIRAHCLEFEFTPFIDIANLIRKLEI